MTQPFVHLRVHSEFSLIDGLVRIKPLVARAQELEIPALALTDQTNFYGQVKFYKACIGAGIKPLSGVDFWLSEGGEDKPTLITLYAMNGDGYRNITELISRAWMEGQYHGHAYVQREWLKEYSEGVLMLSGARYGDVGRALVAGRGPQAEALASEWAEVFPGRYYLELQRTGRPGDEEYLHAAVALAQKLTLPVVATNDVRFLEESEFEAHEVRVCIHEGRALDDPRRERRYSREQYFRTPEEMAALFSDIPEALANTVEIARRCTAPIQLGKYFLPEYPVPEGMTEDQFFEKVSFEGMERRLEKILDRSAPDYAERRRAYDERLRFELDIIVQMGFPGYFLIVMDFIQWAKEHDIPVGPGRGSGAGSLVAYSLDITDLDPLQYDLLFERFLNPERVSMPDFDVDFCMEKRDRVIGYVADNYGRNAVSQIITFGTMAAKAVVRDVARVQGKSYGLADKLSKMIPPDVGMTLQKAFEQEEILREFLQTDDEAQEIWEMALQLEGVSRNVGKHAGGVVIAPTKLTDFAPLYCDETGAGLVTQFDKNDVEDAGLVKFDFLGLRTLTIIDWAKVMVDEQRAREGLESLDIAALPLDDEPTFKMLKKAETTAVFQLESRGMKDLIKRMQPDSLEDMIALVALFRPGPLQSGMVDDFINRKHGRAKVAYPDAKYQHEKLKPILEPTYGVIVYQEQVMQIAQELAGYTLGGADLLRRAMGKKKPEEMAKQREIFEQGAKEQGVDPQLAIKIFDLVEKFAGYGFNKCLHGDTLVVDAGTGAVHRVEDLFRQRASLGELKVHSLDGEGKLVARRVEDVVWNGVKPVYRLITRSGREIVATGNHPLRMLDGWKSLEDLRVGDGIASPRCLRVESQCHWPEHELITLGGLLSEGNTCHPSALYFYNNDRALLEDFAAAVEGFENTRATITWRDDGRGEVCAVRAHKYPWNHPDFQEHRFSGARQWAESLGILGCRATEKFVPPELFQASDDSIALLLGRLWSGDGSICPTHTPPYYATSSRQLAEDVRYLLLRLGIYSTLKKKQFPYRGEKRDGYTLHLCGEGMVARFRKRVCPHLVGRAEDLGLLDDHLRQNTHPRSSRDTVPADIRQWVNEEREAAGLTWGQLESVSGLSMKEFYGNGSAGKKGFRRDTIARLGVVLNSLRLKQQAESDIFWDQVVSIEAEGSADTYDLTVEEHHNFVADGLIVHNSHSAAYALVSYQTAWLKAHYPAQFMAATMSSDMDKTDKVVTFIEECRAMALELVPPDVNLGSYQFSVDGDKRVIYGLGAIKGLGEGPIENIIAEREKGGAFTDLFDFCSRIDPRKVNKRALEALVRSGALDSIGPRADGPEGLNYSRAVMWGALDEAAKAAEQQAANASAGMMDLFGEVVPQAADGDVYADFRRARPWSIRERLEGEKNTLGLYLTGHPIDEYEEELQHLVKARIADLKPGKESQKVAGLVVAMRVMKTKRGDTMAIVTLDDRSGRIEAAVFSEAFGEHREKLAKDALLVLDGPVANDDYSGGLKMTVNGVSTLDELRRGSVTGVRLQLHSASATPGLAQRLAACLQPYTLAPGGAGCNVSLEVVRSDARGVYRLPQQWQVEPNDQLVQSLRELLGRARVSLNYTGRNR